MSAAAAGASLAAHSMVPLPRNRIPAAVAASDRVRFGMIGVGMQGNWLLSESIKLPGVECAAAADLYDGRHMLAREIVRADLPVTRRYQTLLEDKNIDCIVAAVPHHWHKQGRLEEHTSELPSRLQLVWRLLLVKKKNDNRSSHVPAIS